MTDYTGRGGYYENEYKNAPRSESKTPVEYRLAQTYHGMVLQGRFTWEQGSDLGSEWRTLPTIILNP